MAKKSTKEAVQIAPAQNKAAVVADLSAQINEALNPKVEVTATVATKKLATRSGWKGTLQIKGVRFAVATYTAKDDGDKVSFNQTHDACGCKLNQGDMKCAHCDTTVPKENIQKGYQYEDGKFVYVTGAELEACEPASDKLMEVTQFVKVGEIDPIYFDKTEFVGPAGENKKAQAASSAAYAMLRQAMVNTGTVAIVKRCARGREQYMALRPYGVNQIVASDLLFAAEVRGFAKTENLAPANADLVALGESLIADMTKPFDENAQVDSYTVNVRALVNTKIYGQVAPVFVKVEVEADSDDLLAALKASLGKAA